MHKTVLGVFEDRGDTEEAISELKDAGFEPKDISIVMRDRREAAEIGENTGTDVATGAVSGATTGALLGGLAGLVSAFVLPGLGAFFIGGPIAAALGLTGAAATTVSGAVTGAAAGGLLGALMGLGLSQEEAQVYEERLKSGAILLAVPSDSENEDIVRDIFDEYGASEVKTVESGGETSEEAVHQSRVTHTHEHTHGVSMAGARGGKASARRRARS